MPRETGSLEIKESATTKRIPTEQLRPALHKVVEDYYRRPREIKRLRRRLSIYSSSYAIENLQVELDHGDQLSLVLKDLSPASMLSTAKRVRPEFLYDPMREIETYRSMLSGQQLGTPICYGAMVSAKDQRYWLFLERVPGRLLWQMGRMQSWEQAARWLASLHTAFGKASDLHSNRQKHLLYYDRKFLSAWLPRAELFLRRKFTSGSSQTRREFARLANRYDRAIRHLLSLPRSLIHGEFYPSNVILREAEEGRSICPIDWEVAGIGPSVMDLAALTLGDWTEANRRRMVIAYRDALPRQNGWPPELMDLTEAVEYCQLQICIQLLGWATDWSPPQRHAQNWFREALRLARKLGL